ncbi:MAG: LPS export ABC transporter permease LptF [Acidobacteria bacterium]|nr:LPS export ABC transporter permease LptF [Acidobacteriota bacterium]
MRCIDRCIYKELLGPFLISLLVLTFIVFTREMGRFAELLIRNGAEPGTVVEVCLSLLPGILTFTVPLSFLVGTLIAFGRLSSDSEIVAFRACGISSLKLLIPVLKIGGWVFLVTAALTLYLLPYGNRHLLELRYLVGIRQAMSDIRPRVLNEDIANMILYVERIQYKQGIWDGVFVADTTVANEQKIILARRGQVAPQPERGTLQLHFEEGTIYKMDMQDNTRDNLSAFKTLEMSMRVAENGPPPIRPLKPEEKSTFELLVHGESTAKERHKTSVELNRRLALPLSTFAFAFLGLALGINTRRGGRAYGLIIGMLITFSYFVLFVTGSGLAKDGNVPVWLGVWGSNLLLYTGAILALRFMNRDSPSMRVITENKVLLAVLESVRRGWTVLSGRIGRDSSRKNETFAFLRVGFLKVIDLYLVREFFKYFAMTLAISVALFLVFTLFELIDDIVNNHVAPWIVLDYFWYLLPHVLTLAIPMSILVATLVNFGLLDRTHQITALKAAGVSLYRIVVPALLSAAALSIFLFVMQDSVLPFANQKQDNLRNLIKGRPIQTFYHPDRQWIFGQKPRLYNYVRFDSTRNEFAQLSIYDLDIIESRYNSRIYASRAVWDSRQKAWALHHGFVRDFNDPGHGFTFFEDMILRLPEGPSYFAKEVKESTKMRYVELKNHIHSLQQSGFEVEELRVELYKKISFPAVSIIMAMIGIPFAFSMGRKGALHGVTLGILIGIVYWGAFGISEVMGGSGMLAPALAAWAPNLLFATGGVYLLLTIRT